ncbi:MAG: hypothetical protein U0L20_09485 [Ruminococcus sp.]|nr:hypothetical protein [Ruminococcus sp.]
MADVKKIDIDGEQWDIKDETARDRITVLEDSLSTKDLPDAQITMKKGYTCKSIIITNRYKAGKINFATIHIENLSGKGIGGIETAHIVSTNLIPKKITTFIVRDYRTHVTARCNLERDGGISIKASNGIKDGDNEMFGAIIFAEP